MGNKILTIEIMTNLTKICIISNRQNNPKVYQTLLFDTPYDCIEDGYIKDIDTLSEVISVKLREASITVNRVIFTITSTKIANREVVIPYVNENKIQDILKVNGTDYFPMDISDYNISYVVLDKINTKEEKKIRLLLLAAHNNLINTYYSLAAKINLQIESIDYVGNSAYQILRKQVAEETTMSVLMNDHNTLINVISKDILVLQRTIPYGYGAPIQAVMESSNYSVNQEKDAFALLCKESLLYTQFGEVEEEVAATSLSGDRVQESWYLTPSMREEITESLHYLISNIVRVADYYTSKNQDSRIQKVYLSGLGTRFKGLEQLFTNEIGLEVQVIDQLHNITFMPSAIADGLTQSDFLTNIGAVMSPIGMMPRDYIEREEKKSNVMVVAFITSLAIITSILLVLISSNALKEAEKERAHFIESVNALENVESVYQKNEKLKLDLSTMDSLNALNYNSNEQLLQLIEELEVKLPRNTTIHSLRSSKTDFIIDVSVDSKETAAMVLVQLNNVEALVNVRTASIAEEVDELGMVRVKFSVTANYKGATSMGLSVVDELTQEGDSEKEVQ